MAEKCNNCGADVADTTILNDGGVNCPNCEHRIDNQPVTRQQIETIWSTVQMPADNLDVTIKSDDKPRSDSVASRLNLITKPVAQQGEAIEPPPHYEIEKFLGEGGMGIIYRARQTSIDRSVALKMIKPGLAQEKAQRTKFLSEAVAIGDLDHPNIVPIYDLGANEEGVLFYAMKEIKGTPWSEVIGQKTLSENLDILMNVADAVAFAHSRGVIHRDIKPENVMLGDYGEVLLVDWGLAAAVTEEGKADKLGGDAVAGTPSYMPPEMALGDAEAIGTHSDVYLLGAVLYEIVTGNRPHQAEKIIDRLLNASNNVIAKTDKEGELIDIALRAMVTEPGDRYNSVRDFQDAIKEYQTHVESIAVMALASNHLAKAKRSGEYDEFSEAVFGYRQALKLWSENGEAKSGLVVSSLAYAECALTKGDLDLAASLLDENEQAHVTLLCRIRTEKVVRHRRQWRLRALTRGILVLAAVTLIIMVGSAFWIQRSGQERAEAQVKALQAERNQRETQERMEADARREWQLIRQESFSDTADVDAHWDMTEAFTVVDGQVHVPEGNKNELLSLKTNFVAELSGFDVRVDFECHQESDYLNDVTCYIGAYMFQFGGYKNTRNALIRARDQSRLLFEQKASPIRRGELYQARAEKIGGLLRYTVNDVVIFEVEDPNPLHVIDRIGLYSWGADTWWDNVKIYTLGQPLKGDILEIAQRQFELGRHETARDLFEMVVQSGSDRQRMDRARKWIGRAEYLIQSKADAPVYTKQLRTVWPWWDGEVSFLPELGLSLHISDTRLKDLSPLKGMPLARLYIRSPHVSSVHALAGMPLTDLTLVGTLVSDLSPLADMRLSRLHVGTRGQIRDISVLRGMPLEYLNLDGTLIDDLSPLAECPIDILLLCHSRKLQDLSPLSGSTIRVLRLFGSHKVADLGPLRGLDFRWLDLKGTSVTNLSPLKGSTINTLYLASGVTDISPLRGVQRLVTLDMRGAPVSDLSPLENKYMSSLSLKDCDAIDDFSPLGRIQIEGLLNLAGVDALKNLSFLHGDSLKTLTSLDISGCHNIHDLSPLEGLRLRSLRMAPGATDADLALLSDMPLNKLDLANCTNLTNLAGLKGIPLTELDISNCGRIEDLSPLKGMSLISLSCADNRIRDLSPLKGMPLTSLTLSGRALTARNMQIVLSLPLEHLHVRGLLDAPSLTSLHGLPSLETLNYLPIKNGLDLIETVRRSLRGEDVDLLSYASLIYSSTHNRGWISTPKRGKRNRE